MSDDPGPYDVMVQRATDIANVPEHLRCETCGMLPIQVVVTWMTTEDTSRVCIGCFLGLAASVLETMTGAVPA